MFAVKTRDAQDTRALAAALAGVAREGDRLALIGSLGAGKTQFAKGFAVGLGIDEVVNSPTFTLMAEYRGRLPLFHLDLYRLAGPDDAWASGLLDERTASGVALIEWAGRLGERLLSEALVVRLTVLPDDCRLVELLARTPGHDRYMETARQWETTDRGTPIP